MRINVKKSVKASNCEVYSHDKNCDCPECRKMKRTVHASIVPSDDYVSNDIPTDEARDVLFELADMFGAEPVLEDMINWFSTWDLKPLADDILDQANMKYEEE